MRMCGGKGVQFVIGHITGTVQRVLTQDAGM